jgi:adenylate cyclase
VRTLHPDVIGRRFRWQLDKEVLISVATYDVPETTEFRKSLIETVCAEGKSLRRRLADASCQKEFPLLLELLEEGATDLLATPLVFTDGDAHAALWTTRQAGGFTDEQIDGIEHIVDPLARVAEVLALRRRPKRAAAGFWFSRRGSSIGLMC